MARSLLYFNLYEAILRTFFERKALAKEAANWLNGLSNSTPHLNR